MIRQYECLPPTVILPQRNEGARSYQRAQASDLSVTLHAEGVAGGVDVLKDGQSLAQELLSAGIICSAIGHCDQQFGKELLVGLGGGIKVLDFAQQRSWIGVSKAIRL